jgi:hydroxymethylglutaryl-CoA lyase
MTLPSRVSIVEVGPRDGLQNEITFVATKDKINLIERLADAGLKTIEVTSFVSPKAIPQLSDASQVYQGLKHLDHLRLPVLIPNLQGMQQALAVGVREIAIFTAASETFNQRNIKCSIKESIERFSSVIPLAKSHNIRIRAYVSCALGCPYEGEVLPKSVQRVISDLLSLGVDEICLGDTIGVGTPRQTIKVVDVALEVMPVEKLAMHFHDTYGQGIVNIYAALQAGVSIFDASVAGLGGCPYALGATGNVATEDVLYLMHGLGIETGVDIYKVIRAGQEICKIIKRDNQSKVARALLAHR